MNDQPLPGALADNIGAYCRSCRLPYVLNDPSDTTNRRLPLTLPCEHHICERCVKTILNLEFIECKYCLRSTRIHEPSHLLNDETELFLRFPIHVEMVERIKSQILNMVQAAPVYDYNSDEWDEDDDSNFDDDDDANYFEGRFRADQPKDDEDQTPSRLTEYTYKDLRVDQVFPSANIYTYTFKQGDQVPVFLLHVITPNHFYVYLSCLKDARQRLIDELQKCDKRHRLSAKQIKPGAVYLVFDSDKEIWVRGRIEFDSETCSNLFHFFAIDYGHSFYGTLEDIRNLQGKKFKKPAPLAIHCGLSDYSPAYGVEEDNRDTSDTSFMRRVIKHGGAIMKVLCLKPGPGYFELVVDLINIETCVSVLEALEFNGFTMGPWKEKSQEMFLPGRRDYIIKSDDSYSGLIEDVDITHIVNPSDFYIRKKVERELYAEINFELQRESNRLDSPTDIIYLPRRGMAVCVRLEKSETGPYDFWVYVRGVVCSVLGQQDVVVKLVDTGVMIVLPSDKLRYLAYKYTRFPAMARRCCLTGVTSISDTWSEKAIALMHQYGDKNLELFVNGTEKTDLLSVTLFYISDENLKVSINKDMVKEKHAEILNDTYSNRIILQDVKQKLKAKKMVKHAAKLIEYTSPSLFYVSLKNQTKIYETLFSDMQKYYKKNNKPILKSWVVGDKCSVFSTKHKMWCRGVILQVLEKKCQVFCRDFATIEMIPAAKIVPLKYTFAFLKDRAMKCHLTGVTPDMGENWTLKARKFISDILNREFQDLFIGTEGQIKDESVPVEISGETILAGTATEDSRIEVWTLKEKLNDNGFDQPIDAEEAGPPPKDDPPDDDHYPDDHYPDELKWGCTIPIFINDEYTAVATHVDDNGIIYLHNQNMEEELKNIRKEIIQCFKNPQLFELRKEWTANMPCIVRLTMDYLFYRGEVVAVNSKTSTCLVYLIDRGYTQRLPFNHMLVIKKHAHIIKNTPPQVQKCNLNRIQPVSKCWEKSVIEYMRMLVVDKVCSVTVNGSMTVFDVTPITMKYGNIVVEEHLVSLEMATFTDLFESCSIKLESYRTMSDHEFKCSVIGVTPKNNLEVLVELEGDGSIRFKNLIRRLQSSASAMPHLKVICQNKACAALFPSDQQWKRGRIMQYDEIKDTALVRDVDSLREESVHVTNIKKMDSDYLVATPLVVALKLRGIKLNDDAHLGQVTREYFSTFKEDIPFTARVFEIENSILTAELYTQGGNLAYQKLIDSEIFLKCVE